MEVSTRQIQKANTRKKIMEAAYLLMSIKN